MDESTQLLKEAFDRLPEAVKKAILELDLSRALSGIVRDNNLHLDQGVALENETTLLLVGLVSREDYVNNLMESVEVGRETAEKIATEVNARILEPIKASLMEEEDNNLSREDLLREIEAPSPTRFKSPSLIETHGARILGAELPKPPEIPAAVEPSLPPPADLAHELPAPHQESAPLAPPASPPPPPPLSPPAQPPTSTPPTPPPEKPIAQSPRKMIEIHPELRPESRKGSIDPYREPIE